MHALSPREGLIQSSFNFIQIPLGALCTYVNKQHSTWIFDLRCRPNLSVLRMCAARMLLNFSGCRRTRPTHSNNNPVIEF